MARRKDGKNSARICPYLRGEIHHKSLHRYIGMLLIKEFDIIDLFMINESPMTTHAIAAETDRKYDTVSRYVAEMQHAGLLGVTGYHETKVDHKVYSPCKQEKITASRPIAQAIFGVTMKAVALWHNAVGEEWDWSMYDGQPWIADQNVHTGAAGSPIGKARAVGIVA